MNEADQNRPNWEDPGSKMAKRLGQLAAIGDYKQLRRLASRQNCRCRIRETGQTPLMLMAAAAAAGGWDVTDDAWRLQRVKCAELLIAQGAEMRATDRRSGDTAAHVAARAGDLPLLAALPFEAGKFAANAAGVTPLMEAAAGGRWGCAKHLAHLLRDRRYRDKRKALLGAKDRRGLSAADMAEAAGHAELAEVIRTEIRGLTFKEKHEAKELMKLANQAPPEEFRRLASRLNCDWPHAQWFHTSLSCLARRSVNSTSACLDCVRWAIKTSSGSPADCLGADPTSANVAGWSILHVVAGVGATDAARLLVSAGAYVNARDQDGGTPLMEAAAAGHVETARELLSLGANWELADSKGGTAGTAAVKSGNTEMIALIKSYKGKQFFDVNIGAGTSVTAEQSEGAAMEVTDGMAASDDAEFYSVDEDQPESASKPADRSASAHFSMGGEDQVLRYIHADFYPVTNPQGFCLIVNINKYTTSSRFESRDGSERDVERIRDLFANQLKFKVMVRADLTVNGILNCVHEAANSQELENHGSFVCFLMAHGTNDSIYGCDGRPMEIKFLAARLQANICPGLEHKPKIFFVQACRGSRPDFATQLRQRPGGDETVRTDSVESQPAPVKDPLFCPTESDFLFCYANTENAPAYRSPEKGSIFIQTLCDVIEREHRREHLLDMMTKVNRRVKENPVRVGSGTFYHSVPEMRSQLSRKVSLNPAHESQRQ